MSDEDVQQRSGCGACGSKDLALVLDLGRMPLAGAYPLPTDPEPSRYPLRLGRCLACHLVQVMDPVSPEVLFRDYRYLSSIGLTKHFQAFAATVPAALGLARDRLIVEVGCNDGVLLAPLAQQGFTKLLGVDPAENVTGRIPIACPIVSDFFGVDSAAGIRAEHGPAQALIANNVFAHIEDLGDFLGGVDEILADDGVFVFEVHYLVDLLEQLQFDTVYHEHRYYYSLTSLTALLGLHGFVLVDVDRIDNHGGSIRVVAGRSGPPSERALRFLADEERLGLRTDGAYERFALGVASCAERLGALVAELPTDARLAAYGAAGRAVIFFNYVPTVAAATRYVIDDSPERAGRLIPGVDIPILPLSTVLTDPPDVVLLSAWTYADALREKLRAVVADPTRVRTIIPLPVPSVSDL